MSHCHSHQDSHTHSHGHAHTHACGHTHGHGEAIPPHTDRKETILCIRPQSGLSGDMLLCGLSLMLGLDSTQLAERLQSLSLPAAENCVQIENRMIHGIQGKYARVSLPHEHAHRSLNDILGIINASSMPQAAKNLSAKAFALLAEAEGAVHGKPKEDVTFHEVGALDSIVDICLACLLFAELNPDRFICGPLPLADGTIHCQHGLIPSPAPAVLNLLRGVSVCSFAGNGETVTPTAIALLKSLGAVFGSWPHMDVEKTALVYGSKIFENAPNGSIFTFGSSL